jgi:hypothetical protein
MRYLPYFNGGHLEFSYSTYAGIVRIHNQALCVQKCVRIRHLESPNIINIHQWRISHILMAAILDILPSSRASPHFYEVDPRLLFLESSPEMKSVSKIESEKVVTDSIGFASTKCIYSLSE